jgi:hypothetical protein
MANPTKHQEDLFIDDVVRREDAISIEDLAAKNGLSVARIRARVNYDIGKNRATKLADGRIKFHLANMANRWVKPFEG